MQVSKKTIKIKLTSFINSRESSLTVAECFLKENLYILKITSPRFLSLEIDKIKFQKGVCILYTSEICASMWVQIRFGNKSVSTHF